MEDFEIPPPPPPIEIPKKYEHHFPPPPHSWFEPDKIPSISYEEVDESFSEKTLNIINKDKNIAINPHGSINTSDILVIPNGITIKTHSIIGTSTRLVFSSPFNNILDDKTITDKTFRTYIKEGLKRIDETNQYNIYDYAYEDVVNPSTNLLTYPPRSIIPNVLFEFHKNGKGRWERDLVLNIIKDEKWKYNQIIINISKNKLLLSELIDLLLVNNIIDITLYIYSCLPLQLPEGIPQWMISDCLGYLPYYIPQMDRKTSRSTFLTLTSEPGRSSITDEDEYYEKGEEEVHKFDKEEMCILEQEMGSIDFEDIVYNFLRLFPEIGYPKTFAEHLQKTFEVHEEEYEYILHSYPDSSVPIYLSKMYEEKVEESSQENYITMFYYLFRYRLTEYNPNKTFILSPWDYTPFIIRSQFGNSDPLLNKYEKVKNQYSIAGMVPCIIILLHSSMKCYTKLKFFQLKPIMKSIKEKNIKEFFKLIIDIRLIAYNHKDITNCEKIDINNYSDEELKDIYNIIS